MIPTKWVALNESSENYVKFFPLADRPPPAFFEAIFDLVANTCSISTCKMDDVIKLLKRAYYAACPGYEGAQGHGPWPIAPGVASVGRHGQSKPEYTLDFVSFSGVSFDPIQGNFHLRLRMVLDMTVLVQNLMRPFLVVTIAFDFIYLPY